MRIIPFLIFFFTHITYSQDTTWKLNAQKIWDSSELVKPYEGISYYDDFNLTLGGKSVRYCNDYPCDGWIEDYYTTGTLAHRGFYLLGELQTFYNYYPSKVKEREFIEMPDGSKQFASFFPNGKPRIKIQFNKKRKIVKYESYYENGNYQIIEVYEPSGKYPIEKKEFFPKGLLAISLKLINEKKLIYDYREFYDNGSLRTSGFYVYKDSLIKDDKWFYYSSQGILIKKENYKQGKIVKEEFIK